MTASSPSRKRRQDCRAARGPQQKRNETKHSRQDKTHHIHAHHTSRPRCWATLHECVDDLARAASICICLSRTRAGRARCVRVHRLGGHLEDGRSRVHHGDRDLGEDGADDGSLLRVWHFLALAERQQHALGERAGPVLFRLLLGWAVPPKVSFLKQTQTNAVRKLVATQHVIQDMHLHLPMSKYIEAHEVFHGNYNLCPRCGPGARPARPSATVARRLRTAAFRRSDPSSRWARTTTCTLTSAPTASPATARHAPLGRRQGRPQSRGLRRVRARLPTALRRQTKTKSAAP